MPSNWNRYAQLRHDRFMELKQTLGADIEVNCVMSDEEYAIPSKQAGFLPYDAVVVLDSGHWDENELASFLDDLGLEYDRITGVTDNSKTNKEGVAAGYISLVNYSDFASSGSEKEDESRTPW